MKFFVLLYDIECKNFVGLYHFEVYWGHSSVGRAPRLQRGGRRFESVWLQFVKSINIKS